MSFRFLEISHLEHRILNPCSEDKVALVGERCEFEPGDTVLDLCCGAGEMLATWAAAHGIDGVGVDISAAFLELGRARTNELGVTDRIELVEGEAAQFARDDDRTYDAVACIGSTWIGGGLTGTLELMAPRVRPDGLLLVGEPFWLGDPPPPDLDFIGLDRDDTTPLAGVAERCRAVGFDVIDMVLATSDDWDRYMATQWRAVDRFARHHPDDPEIGELLAWNDANRQSYLEHERRHLGWGIFVLRRPPPG